ncbi:MAG: alkaline phosphatase family protein [Chitinophagaceae bacterium]|nr:alkaline phosphatase family protein [Chitinophagaceae bacterium]
MKSFMTCILFFAAIQEISNQGTPTKQSTTAITPTGNLFIITIDGFRWQEIFNGADSSIINDARYCPDSETMKMMYWSSDVEGRRKKLLPFFWNVIGERGQLYGNRRLNNKMNTANGFSISYPGYNEIFSGATDLSIATNSRYTNSHINVLEYLANRDGFQGKVAAFTSWDVFPYILNKSKSHIVINSGYEKMESCSSTQELISEVQEKHMLNKTETRHDELTFLTAIEYLRSSAPKVLYLALGETDEAAHDGRYDTYLEKASEADRMLARLWHFVQTTKGYKDNTTFVITTDHGRGNRRGNWMQHGTFITGSSQTWMGVIGPNIEPLGEVKDEQQIYQKQLAQTIAALVGETFISDRKIAPAIALQ